jgi:choline dehydrogenase-like flavoprotein
MQIDLNSAGPADARADVAIVGAGAAGIILARRLLSRGLSVLLLESGGLDYEPDAADLNEGELLGRDYYRLRDARLRMFGGTTAIWGGRCSELEPIDFEARPWVPHSGWPVTYDEIKPYYAEARAALGLAAPLAASSLRSEGVPLPSFDPNELGIRVWSFDEKFDRFNYSNCRDLVDHPKCTVITHATVRAVVATGDARAVDRLDVRSLTGRRMNAVADTYVLAAGGIENPRILLASDDVIPAGLGNRHDQVGRYFMEHPHGRGGKVVDGAAWRLLAAFAKRKVAGRLVAPLIVPSVALQEREGLLNTSLTIVPRRPIGAQEALAMRAYLHAKHQIAPTSGGRKLWLTAKKTVGWLQQHTDPLRPWLLHQANRLDVALLLRAEQAPNPDSRVVLSRERDALGMRRAALSWHTSALDVWSADRLVAALGREFSRLGLGNVQPAEWLSAAEKEWRTDPLISAHPIGGYHHMGTTRMSDDPKTGVTDRQGRVHGIANLFVAGSSLFPTSGWSNPTLTIVALALRMADTVAEECEHSAIPQTRTANRVSA